MGDAINEVFNKSMDWYEGTARTKAAKKIIKEYNRGIDKLYSKRNFTSGSYKAKEKFEKNIMPRVAGVGYEDTKEAREWPLKYDLIKYN